MSTFSGDTLFQKNHSLSPKSKNNEKIKIESNTLLENLVTSNQALEFGLKSPTLNIGI
jgi:hypothetical protein